MIQEGRVEVGEGEQLVAGPSLTSTTVACSDSGSAYQQVMSEETGLDAVRGLYCTDCTCYSIRTYMYLVHNVQYC